jgi:DNA topoisomerase-1
VLWNEPTGEVCPKCGSLLVKENKKIKCSNKNCDFEEKTKAQILTLDK